VSLSESEWASSQPDGRGEEILREYPYLGAEDIVEALSYVAWRAEEVEVRLGHQM
jgi:uncharacterized protein (DUF433 family)